MALLPVAELVHDGELVSLMGGLEATPACPVDLGDSLTGVDIGATLPGAVFRLCIRSQWPPILWASRGRL